MSQIEGHVAHLRADGGSPGRLPYKKAELTNPSIHSKLVRLYHMRYGVAGLEEKKEIAQFQNGRFYF